MRENISNYISDKMLIPKIYKKHLHPSNNQVITQFKNEQRTWIDISLVKTYIRPIAI